MKKIILKMIQKNILLFIVICIFMLLSNFIGYAIPYLFKLFADKLAACSFTEIIVYIGLLLFTGFVSYISLILSDKFFFIYSEKFAFSLRDDILKKIYFSSFELFNKTDLNVFLRIVVSDSEEIKTAFSTMIFVLISIIFDTAILIFFMLKLEWKLSLACIIWNFLFFILTNKFSKNIQTSQKEERSEYGAVISLYKDFIQDHVDFRFFSQLSIFQNHMLPIKQAYIKKSMKAKMASSYYNYLPKIGQFFLFSLILLYGFYQAKQGILDITSLLAIFMYTGYFNPIFMKIFHIKSVYLKFKGIFAPIKSILDQKEYDENCEIVSTIDKIENISVSALSVDYGKKNIIHNLSGTFNTNTIYFIQGESGSGKSTFIKALLNLVPYSGTVLYNNTDSKNIGLINIYKQTGYLQQDVYVLNDSISNNISFYDMGISKDKIDALLETVKMPSIKDSSFNLGSQGSEKISGGEKKRLALARLLSVIENKNIVVFDETFTNIEIELKKELISLILPLCKNKIIFVISHEPDVLGFFNTGEIHCEKFKIR